MPPLACALMTFPKLREVATFRGFLGIFPLSWDNNSVGSMIVRILLSEKKTAAQVEK